MANFETATLKSHGCHGLGGDALAPAGKTQAFGGGGLHTDPRSLDLQNLRDLGLHGVAVWPHLGPLADDGDIPMIDDPAPGPDKIGGMVQESPGGSTFPAVVGGREMLADIAFADAAEQRVGDGVQADIGVGMAFQGVGVRHFEATEPDVIAIGEFVYVIAGGAAYIT